MSRGACVHVDVCTDSATAVASEFVTLIACAGILIKLFTAFRIIFSDFLNAYTSQDVDEATDDSRCCICLENLTGKYGDARVRVNCGHHFHATCLTSWLETSDACPLCRKSVN